MSTFKHLFSTLTFQYGVLDDKTVKKMIQYFTDRQHKFHSFFIVNENGATGKNSHIHIYAHLKVAKRTDSFTRTMRSFYTSGLTVNQYTVRTLKEKDPVYRVGCYMQKESTHKVILCHNLDPDKVKMQYINRNDSATEMLKNKNNRRYTINQLPSVYIAYCDEKELPFEDFDNNFADMIRDGYITCTQMKNLSLVRHYVYVLKGDPVESYYTYHKQELKS